MASIAQDMRRILDPARPRAILRMNALAALVGGSLMLLIAGPIAQIMGWGGRGPVALAGLILLVLGSDELLIAVGRGVRRLHVLLFAIADLALVAGGLAFLLDGPSVLTVLDRILVAVVAVALGWFAIAEFRAARAL